MMRGTASTWSRARLIRVGLIRVGDDRHVQTLTLHHIICDGWSIGILMDELPEIYARAGGAPAGIAAGTRNPVR